MQSSVVGRSSLQQHERDYAEGTTLEGQSSLAELLSAQVGAVTQLQPDTFSAIIPHACSIP